MNYTFLKDILASPWQIEGQTLNQFYPVFKGLFSGLQIERADEPANHKRFAIDATSRDIVPKFFHDGEDCEDGGDPVEEAYPNVKVINVVPIRGILMKNDTECGPKGTRTLGKRLLEADEEENVIGHIIIAESGGGQACAVPELTEAMQKCTKPIWVWVDGMACSAMYYIACYAKGITASREFDMVGCIGTMAIYEGRAIKSPANEDGEISVTIYADGADEKNLEIKEAINNFNLKPAKDNILNPLNDRFKSDVTANRPQVLPEQLKGRTYFAKDEIGSLIDDIGDFDSVVQRIITLADFTSQPQPTGGNQSQNNSKIAMKQLPLLNKALNVDELQSSDEGVFLNEEQLTAIETSLEANQQLVTERDNAVQEKATAEGTLATAQQTIAQAYDPFNDIDPTIASAASAEEKATAIRALLAKKPSVVPAQNLGGNGGNQNSEVDWDTINSLPHNKIADNL